MINSFLRFKTKYVDSQSSKLNDIQKANKVLFSLFTRYGDTIIDLVVIKEFIEYYPDKEYLILCPRQMQPYVNELLPNIECIALNKRNLFDIFKINQKLKKWQPDVGFNPWSNGLDSCYFLTYCRNFLCYKDYDRPDVVNHYQVVRRYFQLPEQEWKIKKLNLKDNYQRILICPQSTDRNRGISKDEIDALISDFNTKYHNPDITIASMDAAHFRRNCQQFQFRKSAQSSVQFINLIKSSDLVVCADSGPLHISSAFDKDMIVVFYTTSPEIVLNAGECIYLHGGKSEK
jgi:ADP-heptose:LPS heptosyltransferase